MFPRLEGINFCPLLKAHVLSTKMAITDNVRVRKCHWLHIIRSFIEKHTYHHVLLYLESIYHCNLDEVENKVDLVPG